MAGARRSAESRRMAHPGGAAQRPRSASPRVALPRQARAARRAGRALRGRRRSADDADERLPLLFGCCHPALSPDAQLALTLRAVCGLTTAQIARATFSAEPTVAQRIVRAKRKIGAAGIPLRIPERGRAGGAPRHRADRRLGHVQRGAPGRRRRRERRPRPRRRCPVARPRGRRGAAARGRGAGAARAAASSTARASPPAPSTASSCCSGSRTGRDGMPRSSPTRGRRCERAAMLRRPGRWQLHAAIAACHADAASSDATDWLQVLTLYDMLLAYDRSPVVRLNRAVALARIEGPAEALAEVDALEDALARSHLWHAVRAQLLRELGRDDEALAAGPAALELTANEAERRLLDGAPGALTERSRSPAAPPRSTCPECTRARRVAYVQCKSIGRAAAWRGTRPSRSGADGCQGVGDQALERRHAVPREDRLEVALHRRVPGPAQRVDVAGRRPRRPRSRRCAPCRARRAP